MAEHTNRLTTKRVMRLVAGQDHADALEVLAGAACTVLARAFPSDPRSAALALEMHTRRMEVALRKHYEGTKA